MLDRAGFWMRVLVMFFDLIIIAILVVVIAVVFVRWPPPVRDDLANRIVSSVLLSTVLAYTFLEVLARGTPGKLLLRMQIVAADDQTADRWRLFSRWLGKYFWLVCALIYVLSNFGIFYMLEGFMSLIALIGCLYAANDDKRAWHDHWAGTVVCYRPQSPQKHHSFPVIQQSE